MRLQIWSYEVYGVPFWPLLQGPLWSEVVVTIKNPIWDNKSFLKFLALDWNTWNHITVYKQMIIIK